MAELNLNTIKDAIVAELKTNAALFTSTAEANKIRAITTGKPEIFNQDQMFPYIFVTNGSPPDKIQPEKFLLSDAIKLLEHHLRFEVVCVVNEQDSRKAESELDNYTELILETMELDRSINDQVDTSEFVQMSDMEAIETTTHGVRGRRHIFECVLLTGA